MLDAFSASADGYLVKPIERRKLLATLKDAGLEIDPVLSRAPSPITALDPEPLADPPSWQGAFLVLFSLSSDRDLARSRGCMFRSIDTADRSPGLSRGGGGRPRRTRRDRRPLQVAAGEDLPRLGRLGRVLRARSRSACRGLADAAGHAGRLGRRPAGGHRGHPRHPAPAGEGPGLRRHEERRGHARRREHRPARAASSSLAVRFAEAVSWFESELLDHRPATAWPSCMAEESRAWSSTPISSTTSSARRDHTLPAEQEALLAGGRPDGARRRPGLQRLRQRRPELRRRSPTRTAARST